MEKEKLLTIRKTTYGVSEIEVLQFDYHDYAELPTYDIGLGTVNMEAMNRVLHAINKGFKIEYVIEKEKK